MTNIEAGPRTEEFTEAQTADKTLEGLINRAESVTREQLGFTENWMKQLLREKFGLYDELTPQEGEVRLLALLGEHDPKQFVHTIEVVKITSDHLPDFKADLETEGVTSADVLKAGLLHDIGKLAVPAAILKGKTSTELLRQKYLEMHPGEQGMEHEPDYRKLVPLVKIFENDPEILEQITQNGLDPGISLMDALRIHEQKSADLILSMRNLPRREIISQLAGAHHGYNLSRQRTVAEEIVHLSDVQHAIMQRRPYQKPHSEIEALFIIMADTKKGIFREAIAKKWIARGLKIWESRGQALNQDKQEPDKHRALEDFARGVIESEQKAA